MNVRNDSFLLSTAEAVLRQILIVNNQFKKFLLSTAEAVLRPCSLLIIFVCVLISIVYR